MLIYAFRDESDNSKIVLTDDPDCSKFQVRFKQSHFIFSKKFQIEEMPKLGFSITEQEHAIKDIKTTGYYLYRPN